MVEDLRNCSHYSSIQIQEAESYPQNSGILRNLEDNPSVKSSMANSMLRTLQSQNQPQVISNPAQQTPIKCDHQSEKTCVYCKKSYCQECNSDHPQQHLQFKKEDILQTIVKPISTLSGLDKDTQHRAELALMDPCKANMLDFLLLYRESLNQVIDSIREVEYKKEKVKEDEYVSVPCCQKKIPKYEFQACILNQTPNSKFEEILRLQSGPMAYKKIDFCCNKKEETISYKEAIDIGFNNSFMNKVGKQQDQGQPFYNLNSESKTLSIFFPDTMTKQQIHLSWQPPKSQYQSYQIASDFYIVGGKCDADLSRTKKSIWKYSATLKDFDPVLDSKNEKPLLLQFDRLCHSIANIFNQETLVITGSRVVESAKKVEIVDLKTKKVATLKSLSQDIYAHGSVILKNVLYVFGGLTSEKMTNKKIFKMDLQIFHFDVKKSAKALKWEEIKWPEITEKFFPKFYFGACALDNQKVLLVGGMGLQLIQEPADRDKYIQKNDCFIADFNAFELVQVSDYECKYNASLLFSDPVNRPGQALSISYDESFISRFDNGIWTLMRH